VFGPAREEVKVSISIPSSWRLISPLSHEGFVPTLLDYLCGPFGGAIPTGVRPPRVIGRCETGSDVNRVATSIRRKGESVVAIHDSFSHNMRGTKRLFVSELPQDGQCSLSACYFFCS
jgi:hypothetical protein